MPCLLRLWPIVWYVLLVLPAYAQHGEFVIRKKVRLVEAYASVSDQKGRYLDGRREHWHRAFLGALSDLKADT